MLHSLIERSLMYDTNVCIIHTFNSKPAHNAPFSPPSPAPGPGHLSLFFQGDTCPTVGIAHLHKPPRLGFGKSANARSKFNCSQLNESLLTPVIMGWKLCTSLKYQNLTNNTTTNTRKCTRIIWCLLHYMYITYLPCWSSGLFLLASNCYNHLLKATADLKCP